MGYGISAVFVPLLGCMTRHGQIVRLLLDGLAYIQESATGVVYAFTFDKIEGYGGESAAELGLTLRTPVQFVPLSLIKSDHE